MHKSQSKSKHNSSPLFQTQRSRDRKIIEKREQKDYNVSDVLTQFWHTTTNVPVRTTEPNSTSTNRLDKPSFLFHSFLTLCTYLLIHSNGLFILTSQFFQLFSLDSLRIYPCRKRSKRRTRNLSDLKKSKYQSGTLRVLTCAKLWEFLVALGH